MLALSAVLTILSILAIVTILLKKKKLNTLDIALANTYINNLLYCLNFTVAKYLTEHEQMPTEGMIAFKVGSTFFACETIFLTLAALQQIIAIKYPLRMKVWITKRRVKCVVILVYAVVLPFSLVFNLNDKYLNIFTESQASKVKDWLLKTLIIVLVVAYITLLTVFILKQVHKTNSTDSARQTHGQYRHKRTLCLLTCVALGSLLLVAADIGYNLGMNYDIILTLIFVQWFLSPVSCILFNWKVWKKLCL